MYFEYRVNDIKHRQTLKQWVHFSCGIFTLLMSAVAYAYVVYRTSNALLFLVLHKVKSSIGNLFWGSTPMKLFMGSFLNGISSTKSVTSKTYPFVGISVGLYRRTRLRRIKQFMCNIHSCIYCTINSLSFKSFPTINFGFIILQTL